MSKNIPLTEKPKGDTKGFLKFPICLDLDNLNADIVILGVPYGIPYDIKDYPNDQSKTPDLLRQNAQDAAWEEPRTVKHFDWDLNGSLLDGKAIKIVDCGNVTFEISDPKEHYIRAEKAAKKIFSSNATLIAIGGDHGIPIPIMKALPKTKPITLIQIDAHMDWRDQVNGVKEGYSSPIKRASELDHINSIFQIGLRGVGSGRQEEVDDAMAYGSNIISAYEVHKKGIKNILEMIPSEGPFYITVDADGLDPTIMPAVNAPTPGGLNWIQIRELIHGIVNKGRVLGFDLVEISPSFENGLTSFIHGERLICNLIGAMVRAGYYEK